MNTIIKYTRLPFAFSAAQLQEELQRLTATWVDHFNFAHYSGSWSAIPLRSMNGAIDSSMPAVDNNAVFLDTVFMEQCPYIRDILSHFPCEQKSVRLLKLSPGAEIKEHSDRDLCLEQGEARIHIPITTNPEVEFWLDGERVTMQPGECWYLNFDLLHRLANYGTTDRVHLVFDLVVNDKIAELFNADPASKKLIPQKDKYSADDKQQIILRLREMNTPAAMKLADEMEGGQ